MKDHYAKGQRMGQIVTLDLEADSPVLALPWIITFGPLSDDEEWEPVVCGPYEHAHALGLAETVVADEDLMAVVEPLLPHISVEEIRNEIVSAQLSAEEEEDAETEEDLASLVDDDLEDEDEEEEDEGLDGADLDAEDLDAEEDLADDEDDDDAYQPTPAPSPEEVRAGFARIAARLTAGG